MDIILNAHTEATIERIKKERVVLCPQDTTTLNYSTHLLTGGLGPISKDEDSLGLLLHDTLAFTRKGYSPGYSASPMLGSRPGADREANRRQKLPIGAKRECEVAEELPPGEPDSEAVSGHSAGQHRRP